MTTGGQRRDAAPFRPAASSPLVPVLLALQKLFAVLPSLEPIPVDVEQALGLVLAEPLYAEGPVPARAVALRAGWAVDSGTLEGASAYGPVALVEPPLRVGPGDELPPGADAVLPLDGLELRPGFVEVTCSVAPGEGSRRAGEDAPRGFTYRAAGERLSAVNLAIVGSIGLHRCLVRRPRLALLAASDDPTGALLGRIAEADGAEVSHVPVPSGSGPALLAAIRAAPADVVVVAASDFEEASEAFAGAGTIVAARLACRPGEATCCALVEGRPAILVSRRLTDALAAALLIVRPCLDRLAEARPRPSVFGPLTRKLASTVGLTEIALLRASAEGLEPLAGADLTLAALARADAFLAIPPESEGWPAGARVEAMPL